MKQIFKIYLIIFTFSANASDVFSENNDTAQSEQTTSAKIEPKRMLILTTEITPKSFALSATIATFTMIQLRYYIQNFLLNNKQILFNQINKFAPIIGKYAAIINNNSPNFVKSILKFFLIDKGFSYKNLSWIFFYYALNYKILFNDAMRHKNAVEKIIVSNMLDKQYDIVHDTTVFISNPDIINVSTTSQAFFWQWPMILYRLNNGSMGAMAAGNEGIAIQAFNAPTPQKWPIFSKVINFIYLKIFQEQKVMEHPNMLMVGAVRELGLLTNYSNFPNPDYKTQFICTLEPEGDIMPGTSFCAPQITASLAKIKEAFPEKDNKFIIDFLYKHTTYIANKTATKKLIQILTQGNEIQNWKQTKENKLQNCHQAEDDKLKNLDPTEEKILLLQAFKDQFAQLDIAEHQDNRGNVCFHYQIFETIARYDNFGELTATECKINSDESMNIQYITQHIREYSVPPYHIKQYNKEKNDGYYILNHASLNIALISIMQEKYPLKNIILRNMFTNNKKSSCINFQKFYVGNYFNTKSKAIFYSSINLSASIAVQPYAAAVTAWRY